MWLLLFGACLRARVEALDADIAGLEREIAATEEVVAHMKARLDRARHHIAPTRVARNEPEGFQPSAPIPKGDPSRPDVIVVSVDTLRADHLGAYGYSTSTSPFIDQLAAEGTRFADAWSPSPWTLPSHTTMLSGQLPTRHGTIEDDLHIRDDVPLVQEVFQAAGYQTHGVVATLYVSSKYGFQRGFDRFHDFGVLSKELNNLSTVDANHVAHHALHNLQNSQPGRPVFQFLHMYDPHYAYNAPPPWNEKFDRKPAVGDAVYKKYEDYLKHMIDDAQLAHQIAQYDEEIAYVDEALRQLVTAWRASGRSLIVVVTADHGEEFGERGSWGHGHTLFREQLHVPWIVQGPGIRTQVVDHRVGTEDLAPTVAALAGLRFDPPDGTSRAGTLRTGAPAGGRPGRLADTSRFDTVRYRLHDGAWELQLDARLAWRHLCRVDVDPWCKKNLVDSESARADRMTADLLASLGAPWGVGRAGVVRSEGGFLYEGAKRHKKQATVDVGTRLTVLPQDGDMSWMAPEGGDPLGPWRPLGGVPLDDGAPLTYAGPVGDGLTKTDAERELLEQIGYVQED